MDLSNWLYYRPCLSNARCTCFTYTSLSNSGLIKRMRYCEYMGKYFCQCCHSNHVAVVPGRVLLRWDFACYPVSHFSDDLLRNINSLPLFHVDAINPSLYKKIRVLENVCQLRRQLSHLSTLLNTCKRHST